MSRPADNRPRILVVVAMLGVMACDPPGSYADFHGSTKNLGTPTHGRLLASGDIDGDGKQDFVVGAPHAGSCEQGEVWVWYDGYIEGEPDAIWSRVNLGVLPDCAENFGASVTLGDFNADGYDDLAVGVPGDEVQFQSSAGSIHILYGTSSGLTDSKNQIVHQNMGAISDSSESNDAYGTSLASGDFDCDGYADLAVGVPGESFGDSAGAGAVSILHGSPEGISATRDERIGQSVPEIGDHFGAFLAAGNIDDDTAVNGNDCDDLAVAVPDESLPNSMGIDQPSAGAVVIYRGSRSGLDVARSVLWARDSTDIPGENVASAQFGRGVYILDHNADGFSDLVVHVPGEDRFLIILGGSGGLMGAGASSEEPSIAGWARDACYWACRLAWLLLPPGPECDCSACEILFGADDDPCPHCA